MSTIEEQFDKLRSDVEQLGVTLDVWREAGIPRKTIVVLLNHYTKVPQRTINLILDGIDALYDEYFEEEES